VTRSSFVARISLSSTSSGALALPRASFQPFSRVFTRLAEKLSWKAHNAEPTQRHASTGSFH